MKRNTKETLQIVRDLALARAESIWGDYDPYTDGLLERVVYGVAHETFRGFAQDISDYISEQEAKP